MPEVTLQAIVCRGEVVHLQGIILLPINTDRVLPEVQEAILLRPEAAIRQVLMEVPLLLLLLVAAAGLPHLVVDLQGLNHGVLLQVAVLLREGDRLKQLYSAKKFIL
jgi:hypothetical protein